MMETDTSLENDIRRLVYNHIMAHPGISFTLLKDVLKLNESTLRYHLDYLERAERIIFGLESGKRNYYPHPGERHAVQVTSDTGNQHIYGLTLAQDKILSTIKMYPKINQKELVQRTGINRITLSKNLKKLSALCLVRKVPNGNKVQYEYLENKQLRYEILKQLIKKLLNNELDEVTFLKLKRELD